MRCFQAFTHYTPLPGIIITTLNHRKYHHIVKGFVSIEFTYIHRRVVSLCDVCVCVCFSQTDIVHIQKFNFENIKDVWLDFRLHRIQKVEASLTDFRVNFKRKMNFKTILRFKQFDFLVCFITS